MSSNNNNNYSQYYQPEVPNASKYSSTTSGYRSKYNKQQPNYPESSISNSRVQKQDPYAVLSPSPRTHAKKSIAQEYLKQNSSKFEISSDSEDDDEQEQHSARSSSRNSFNNHKQDSPVLSNDSLKYKQSQPQSSSHPPNKNQQIYQLKMKIMSVQNEFLTEKKLLIDKYEKQLFDLNKQKLTSQQEKNRLVKENEALNKKIHSLIDENEQLKEQLQVFVGQNRKTPNFNSKDFGDNDLVIMNAHKDERIKELETKIDKITKEKESLESSLNKKSDRSSGQSFGNVNSNLSGKHAYLMSFGEIEENLKNSLRQSSKVNDNLIKEVEKIKKQLTQQQERSTKLTLQNMQLEADKQAKTKQIQFLNERVNKSQGKLYYIQKQLQNYGKKIKISQDLLELKQKQVKKLNETVDSQEEKLKRLKKELQKQEKQWSTKNSKLQIQKTLTINEKMQLMKREQSKLLGKIESLLNESKSIQEKYDLLAKQLQEKQQKIQKLQKQRSELVMKIEKSQKQKQELDKKSQETTKLYIKIKHTCTVQSERIQQLQNNLNDAKTQRKNLKEEAQKIMKKQKSEIHTLKKSLQLVTEKSKAVETQLRQKANQKVSQLRDQNESLINRVEQVERENQNLCQQNETIKSHLNEALQANETTKKSLLQYEEMILQLKKENYEQNKESSRLKQSLEFKSVLESQQKQQSKEKQPPSQNQIEQRQSEELEPQMIQSIPIYSNSLEQLSKACKYLQSEYTLLQTKFDKQVEQKQEMVQALNEKIKYFETQLQEDSLRYQEVFNQREYYMKHAESLTYKCQQMYEYIVRMQSQGEGNIQPKKQQIESKSVNQGVQNTENAQKTKEDSNNAAKNNNNINLEAIQQMQRQNEYLKKQVYRLSSQLQTLQIQFNSEMVRMRSSLGSEGSPRKQRKDLPPSSPKHIHDQSSSLQSIGHQHNNPLQSALQIMKIEKQHMLQTVNYQNQMIQSLQKDMYLAVQKIEQLEQNNGIERERKNQEAINLIHQRNAQILEEKLQEISNVIREKEEVIHKMNEQNQLIAQEFKKFQEENKEQANRLLFELNLIKEEKKELHEDLDHANTQLIIMEKEKGKDRTEMMNQLKIEIENKVRFITEDVDRFKAQIKRLKKQNNDLRKQFEMQLHYKQQLYSQERSKLTHDLDRLNKQLHHCQQKLLKANSMISDQKVLQTQISNRNSLIENEYFEMKSHTNQFIAQVENLADKNQRLTEYCHQLETKNEEIVSEMKRKVEQLVMESERLKMDARQLNGKVDMLEGQKIRLLMEINQLEETQNKQLKEIKQAQLTKYVIQSVPSKDIGSISENRQNQPNNSNQNTKFKQQSFFMMENNKNLIENSQLIANSQNIQTQRHNKLLDLYSSDSKPTLPNLTKCDFPQSSNFPINEFSFSKPKFTYPFNPKIYPSQDNKFQFQPNKNHNIPVKYEKVAFNRI